MIGRFGLAIAVASLSVPISILAQVATQWERVHADAQGEQSYDPASVRRTGERVRVTMRLAPIASRSNTAPSYIADYDFDCAGQTSALLSVREFGPEGEALRSTDPEERVDTVPIDAGSFEAPMYRKLCPGARPLPEPPPLSIVVQGTGGNCPSAGEAGRCGNE